MGVGLLAFFGGLFGNYDKPGPGVSKDEPQKAAPIRFFQIFFRKFTKLMQVNLIFVLPLLAVAAMMVCLYLFFPQPVLQLPVGGAVMELNLGVRYVLPLPLILLAPFTAGITFVTRNFAREEHAFVWSDFWSAVKDNWKYFLLNGVVVYLVYVVLSFALTYYYYSAAQNWIAFIPFWLCVVMAVVFLFAQYYLPVMFVTFDLKFGQCYRNALIFTAAGFFRNLLLTVILGALVIVIIGVIPIMPLTVTLLILLFTLIFFSFCGFLINFTIYPVIEQYLIQPYQRKLEEEKKKAPEEDPIEKQFPGLFASDPEPEPEEEEGEKKEKYVYYNGKLVKESELDHSQREE